MARVLIADDASFMRGSLKFIAEHAGHEVVATAKNGKEAVDLYRKLKPDLVTLDILMEDTDGLLALRAIVKEDPDAKVVMVTALGQEEKQEEARRAGASGYIRKPFKSIEVIDAIQKALGPSRHEG
ncbi:response regulator [Acidobacteriia bacterium AH_259_A11_L15]|nr:response regulator [Acidobacteriia bacterium AH_259_A11_L15]